MATSRLDSLKSTKESLQNRDWGWRAKAEAVGFFALFLATWEFVITYFNVPVVIMSQPTRIARFIIREQTVLIEAMIASATFIVTGFIAGSALGLTLGILVSQSKVLERALYPISVVSFVVPKIVIAPIVLYYLGASPIYYTGIPMLLVFFPVLENTRTGLNGVDRHLIDMAKIYKTGRLYRMRHVQIPAALPHIMAGLQIGSMDAVVGLVVAEFIAPNGISQIILIGMHLARTFVSVGGLVLIGVLGILSYSIVKLLSDRLVYWEEVEGGF